MKAFQSDSDAFPNLVTPLSPTDFNLNHNHNHNQAKSLMPNNSQSHNGGFLLYTPVIVLRMIRKSTSQIKIICVLKVTVILLESLMDLRIFLKTMKSGVLVGFHGKHAVCSGAPRSLNWSVLSLAVSLSFGTKTVSYLNSR